METKYNYIHIMKKGFLLFLLIIATAFFLFAKKKRSQHKMTLSGIYTLLEQMNNSHLMFVSYPKTKITIDEQKSTIHCYVGCNSIAGQFKTKGNTIAPLHLSVTEMTCPELTDDLEEKFISNLNLINRFTFSEGQLYLYNKDQLLIVLKKKS